MPKHIIYQLLPRTFTNYNTDCVPNGTMEQNGCGKFNKITDKALLEIKRLGATHIWFTGIIEHATETDYTRFGIQKDNPKVIKGKAGSPYAIKDYYDVDPDLAEDIPHRMQEFEALIHRTHDAGMQVVIDFVANHVARQYHSDAKPKDVVDLGETDHPEWAFSPLNNFYYLPGQTFSTEHITNLSNEHYDEYPAKVTGNDCFNAAPNNNDWYETVKLNYGVHYQGGMEKQFMPLPNTWLKMREILLFWCSKGVDAFRCDMAEMVPVEFWGWVITEVKHQYPQTEFIAEVYNPRLYRSYIFDGHFDYLYDKVGMYDYLRSVTSHDYAAEGITSQWQAVEDIQSHMLYFLENHDEQRIASGFFCGNGLSAEPAMVVAACLGKNPVLIYAGQEIGEQGMDAEGFSGIDGRTTIFDYWGVKSLQAWANNGHFDGALLNKEQKELRDFYSRLLNLSMNNKALKDGLMFDLEYVQNNNFNRHKQYAFLRKYNEETLLVIVNFDAREVEINVNIPPAAFTYLDMSVAESVKWHDLLSEKDITTSCLKADSPISIKVPAWKGLILQMQKL